MNKNALHDPIWFTPPDGSSRVLWKDSPERPAAPDYRGAAEATASGNLQNTQLATAANRVNQYSPYGSSTWSQADANDPASQWSQHINLSPTGSSLLNSLNNSQLGIADLQQGATDTVRGTMGQPFNYTGPQIQGGVDRVPLQGSVDNPGAQTAFDTSGVAPIPQVDAEARRHAEDTAYRAATSRLDPEWAQRNAAQDTQLRNQGLDTGSEAYGNAKRVSGQQQNDAYLQAQANAVNQGLTNQQAQFGMGMAANQAGFGQAQAQGQFANQGRAQNFSQGLNAANFGNQAAGQQFNQGLAAGQFGNTAAQQGLAHQLALYNQPLNALSAIRSGSQVTNPQFPNYAQQQAVPGANYSGAAGQQGQWDTNLYNQSVGQANAFNQGLFSLGSAALGGFRP